jgi:hypothetical protein
MANIANLSQDDLMDDEDQVSDPIMSDPEEAQRMARY